MPLCEVVRTTTESYIASLPEDRSPTPSSSTAGGGAGGEQRDEDAEAEAEAAVDGEAGSQDAGSAEGGGDEEGDGEKADIDDTASTPPPRIPTPILQASGGHRNDPKSYTDFPVYNRGYIS